MDLLGTSINAAVGALVGIVLVRLGKERFEALDRGFDGVESRIGDAEARLGARMDRVETRLVGTETLLDGRIDGLDGRFGTLRSSMDAMRSDLTQVALAVGVRPRVQNDRSSETVGPRRNPGHRGPDPVASPPIE